MRVTFVLVAAIQDVVDRLRELVPGVTGKRLQKLLYYAQAWSLVWDRQSLFADDFEAWTEGPVARAAFAEDRHGSRRAPLPGSEPLTDAQNETIEAVVELYGKKSGDWLSRLTHREEPWRMARAGLAPTEKSKNPISKVAMAAFYSDMKWGDGKAFSPEYERGLELLVSTPEAEVAEFETAAAVSASDHIAWLETGEEQ